MNFLCVKIIHNNVDKMFVVLCILVILYTEHFAYFVCFMTWSTSLCILTNLRIYGHVCTYACPSIHPPIHPSARMGTYVRMYIHSFTHLSVYLRKRVYAVTKKHRLSILLWWTEITFCIRINPGCQQKWNLWEWQTTHDQVIKLVKIIYQNLKLTQL
jgi:hypothetical protein